MLLSGNADKASSILGTSIGGRLKEANLVRRRKVSIPELGPTPMTTVQEVPMDSRKVSPKRRKTRILISYSNHTRPSSSA